MADINLEDLSRDELKKLRKDIDKAIKSYDARKKKEAVTAVEAKAREFGFSLSELIGDAKPGKAVNRPKYRHPENPERTWTGRGRQPAWIKEHIDGGNSLDELLIC